MTYERFETAISRKTTVNVQIVLHITANVLNYFPLRLIFLHNVAVALAELFV